MPEEFEDHCSSVGRCTNNPILYLMRKNLIPKNLAENIEEDYVMLYLQIIQRADIAKATNVNDVNLETSGSRAREAHANTDNAKLFDLAKTAFCKTSLWVHSKPSQRSYNGRQALKMIWYNQLGLHALDERNTKNHKDICALAYHEEKKMHNWKAYFIGNKKFQNVQTALVGQDFNDFTDREKVTFPIEEIK